jgi:NitT/TauT family transport system substrate-binding protein
MSHRPFLRFIVACAFCAALAPSHGEAQQPYHLRLGAVPVDVGAVAYYGVDGGFFKKAGLDVELVALANGPAIAAAVASGTIDAGSSNALSLAQAHERGLNFVFIAPAGAYTSNVPTAGMVVAKTSTAATAKDFTGKTIAVATLGSLGEIGTRAWLDQNGVDLKTVKFIEMPYSAMTAALTAGRVDAATMEEPALDRALATDARLFAPVYDAIGKDFSEGGFFATADFVKTHLDVMRRFSSAVTEASRWANANQTASGLILQKYSGISTADLKHRVHYHDKLDPARIQPLINAAAKYGTLKATFPATELLAPGLF